MIDNDPIGTAGRATKRSQRLGSGPQVCPFCGYADPVALIRVTAEWLREHDVPSTLFEGHHPLGENHDPELTVLICRNCHAKATEGLLCAGISMRPEPNPVARVALMLDAMAELDETQAAARRRCAELLRKSSENTNE